MKSAAQLLEEKTTIPRQAFSLRLPESTMNALTKLRDRLNAKRGESRVVSINDIVQVAVNNFLEREGFKIS